MGQEWSNPNCGGATAAGKDCGCGCGGAKKAALASNTTPASGLSGLQCFGAGSGCPLGNMGANNGICGLRKNVDPVCAAAKKEISCVKETQKNTIKQIKDQNRQAVKRLKCQQKIAVGEVDLANKRRLNQLQAAYVCKGC